MYSQSIKMAYQDLVVLGYFQCCLFNQGYDYLMGYYYLIGKITCELGSSMYFFQKLKHLKMPALASSSQQNNNNSASKSTTPSSSSAKAGSAINLNPFSGALWERREPL